MGPTYQYKAKLVRVVDGDTVWLDVDVGFRTSVSIDFRLYGINAPESVGPSKAAGLEAKEFLGRMLQGKEIVVESRKTEKYGRWLGTIWFQSIASKGSVPAGTWISANQEMLDNNHAVVYLP
jgi:micrococcal nuclease